MPDEETLLHYDDLEGEGFGAERTIRRYVRRGAFPPPLKLGGRVVWRTAEVAAWVAAGMPPMDKWTWEPGETGQGPY